MFSRIYALIILNILDFFFTNKLLSIGFTEGNPILDYIIGSGQSDTKLLYTKLLLVPILCFVLYVISQFRRNTRYLSLMIDILLITYGLINSLHIYIFLREGIFTF